VSVATTIARRPTAQDFLELVERGKRGRLHLHIVSFDGGEEMA
jgi:hypothetical protein